MPPNVWMAVRQVQQSVPGASMSWKASAEKNRSKTAYKSYCCARDDFGRPIFCNTAYSRLEYPAGALTRESTLALNRNCPSAEPKLVDLASSSKAIPRCSHCDFGRWRQCVGKGGAAGRRLARTQGSRGRIHGRVQRAPNREFPFGTLSAVQILKRGMLE